MKGGGYGGGENMNGGSGGGVSISPRGGKGIIITGDATPPSPLASSPAIIKISGVRRMYCSTAVRIENIV